MRNRLAESGNGNVLHARPPGGVRPIGSWPLWHQSDAGRFQPVALTKPLYQLFPTKVNHVCRIRRFGQDLSAPCISNELVVIELVRELCK